MTTTEFQRARSAEAKQQREQAILDAAAMLGAEHGIRQVTLTDIAAAVGMHKSALLRYFETREQIFLRLTAAGWREWSAAFRAELAEAPDASPRSISRLLAASLTTRPLFCDLLGQAPMNLERNVSLDAVKAFKLVTLDEVTTLAHALDAALPGLGYPDAREVVAAAVALAGALWQMATPSGPVRELFRSAPELGHAVVDVEPRLAGILEAQLKGYLAE